MLKNCLISSEENNLRFEVLDIYSSTGVAFHNCENLEYESFIKLHKKGLFNSKKVLVFLNVQTYKDADLREFLEKETITTDVVWGFKTLGKNLKLYKLLEKSGIDICTISSLDKPHEKRKFISKLLSIHHIPGRLLEDFNLRLPEDKFIIESEILKVKKLVELGADDSLVLRSISVYSSTFDLLEFLNSILLNDLKKSYVLAKKVAEESHELVIQAVLLKRIKSLIFLNLGDVSTANKYWRTGPYYLNDSISLANTFGFEKLDELYTYVDYIFSEYNYDYKSNFLKLCQLILYVRSLFLKVL